jgi:hypothetical protein
MTDRSAQRASADSAAGKPEEPYDAGNERHVRDKAARVKTRDLQRLSGMKLAMGTAEGRAWIWSLLEFCGPMRTPFSAERQRTDFNCGQQNVGLYLLAELQRHCLTEYTTMQKENANV